MISVRFVLLSPRNLIISLALVLLSSISFSVAQNGTHNKIGGVVDLSQPLTLRWSYQSNLTLNLTPAFDSESIYLPLAGGNIVALRASNGELRWRSEIGGELSASPTADEEQIYVASQIGGDDKDRSRRTATGTQCSIYGNKLSEMRCCRLRSSSSQT